MRRAPREARVTARAGAPSTIFRCSACSARYDDLGWLALSLFERIESSEVRRILRDWPDTVCIEIRCCDRCGHTIAGKRSTGAGHPMGGGDGE